MEQLIGRKEEIAVLKKALKSTNAEMVSVIGRRRVGKTFLINQIYEKHIVFSISGTQNTPLKEQLGNFAYLLNEYANPKIAYKTPTSWQEAFQMLITYLKFSNQLFSISKTYFENLSDKVNIFKATTKIRKQIFLVFITTFGLTENQYSSGIVSRSLVLEDLFREV
ncbi:MAG: hypothetical protein AB8G86_18325 [Saprospiraceae bacterium]